MKTKTHRKFLSLLCALVLCLTLTADGVYASTLSYNGGIGYTGGIDDIAGGDSGGSSGPGGNSGGSGDQNGGDQNGGNQNGGGDSDSGSSEITVTEDGDYYVVTGVLGSYSSDDSNDHTYTTSVYYDGNTLYSMISGLTTSAADGFSITDSTSSHSAFVLKDVGDYTISDAEITMVTDADGSDTSDFTGVGSAIAVFGDSNVTIEDSSIESTGVATMPLFVDDGATVTVDSSTLISNGGTLYASYVNSPDQSTMVAPPWVLGIMGTSRATNLMGTDSTMNVIDSETYAGAWAVLSTDSGSDMVLNVYNTTLELMNADESEAAAIQEDGGQITTYDNPYTVNYGSGYGTYAIGDAVETFAGATIHVGTYATIFTGGSAIYTSLTADAIYTLANAASEDDDILYVASEDKVTTIDSDTFGFMFHQNENTIVIEKGTIVNSGYATFLVKSGSSDESVTAAIDDAQISNGGVLIQVMDNDDATTSGTTSTAFATSHTENAGFNTSSASNDGSTQDFTFTNGTYSGNIYNASGSDSSTAGALDATTLNVTLGTGATLIGAAASTAAIHVTYDGSQIVKANGGDAYDTQSEAAEVLAEQNTSFTISEYWSIGQVANLVNSNGGNEINMTLEDGAAWYVDGTSLITSLTLDDESTVYIAEGASLTIGSTTYDEEGTLTYENGSLTFTAGEVEIPQTGDEDDAEDDDDGNSNDDGGNSDDGTCYHKVTSVVNAKDATCTEDGYTGDTVCEYCGETISYGEAIPATGHSYVSEVTTAPTCTEEGVETYTCSVCGDTYTESIAATGHSYTSVENEDGSVTYTCSVCGDTYTEEVKEAPEVSLTVSQSSTAGRIKMQAVIENYNSCYEETAHGFVYISKTLLGSKTLTLSTLGRTKVTVNGITSAGSYAYSMKPSSSSKEYVMRAWVAYTDADGDTKYVYSSAVTCSYDGLK